MIELVNPTPYMPDMSRVADYYQDSLRAGQLSNFGPCWWAASSRIAGLTGRYAVPVSSGTAALQIALLIATLERRPPTIVIPEFTFAATEIAARAAGNVVALPCDAQTWTIANEWVTRSRLGGTVLVIVAPCGYCVDFEYWDAIGIQYGCRVVYDLAGAWGMDIETKNPCAISFHATKNLPIGEGGVVLCEPEQFKRARQLSNFDFDDDRVPQSTRGINGKLDELHSAMLLAQLDQNDRVLERIEAKRDLLNHYFDALPGVLVPHNLHLGNAAPSLCAARVSAVGGEYSPAEGAQRIVKIGKANGFVVRRAYWPNVCGGRSLEDVIALPSDIVPGGADFKHVVESIREGFA